MEHLAAEQEYELINGEEVMLAAASIPHLGIQLSLARIIGNYLKGKRCKAQQKMTTFIYL